MSVLTANGKAVLEARIRMPRAGAWVADLRVDATASLGEAVTIAAFDGGLTLKGTVVSGDVAYDVASITVVGGAGGLQREVGPKFYRAFPVRQAVTELLAEVGETLASSSSTAVLARTLKLWARPEGTAATALAELAAAAGASWRVLDDGTVWVGVDAWAAAPAFRYDVLDDVPAQDRITIAGDAPRLLPGVTFRDRRVSLVVHTIDDAGVRSEVWFEADDDGESRLLGALRRLVRKLGHRVDYLAPHPCRVVSQNGDGTLELKPDDARLPGLSRVPIRAGLPGVTVKVAAGARTYVEFEDGDPQRPVARGWEIAGVTELQMSGAAPVARQGDAVSTSIPPGYTFQAIITPTVPLAPVQPGTPVPVALTCVLAPIPLMGVVVTGSGIVKA